MHKKVILIFTLILSTYSCMAQSVGDLFYDFSHVDNVERVNLNPVIMTLVRPFINTAEFNGIRVKAVQVMDLSECNPEIKREFSRRVMEVEDDIYETLVQVNEGDETVKVLAKTEGEYIKELVVLTTGNDAAYIRLRGKFSIADAQKLAEKH
jgi:hypothetical protein